MSQRKFCWVWSLLLVILSLLLSRVDSQKSQKCDADAKKELDEAVYRIMTYGTDRKYPTNKAELKDYCKEQTKLVAKVENHKNNCLKGQAKSIVSVISYSIKQVVNNYCKHPSSKKTGDLIKSAKCANAATKKYYECNDDYVRILYHASTLKDSKERLGNACCGFFKIPKCVREKATKLGGDCDEANIEANIDYIRAYFENAINAICGDYTENSDKCENLKLGYLKPTKSGMPKSFINPLVGLLTNI